MTNAPAASVNHKSKILVLIKYAQGLMFTLHMTSEDSPYCQLTNSAVKDSLLILCYSNNSIFL